MRILVASLAILLTGCTTVVPVARTFPEVPTILREKCEKLKSIEGYKVAITDMLKTVVANYSLYYECSAKVEGWNEWYQAQKQLF